MRQKLEDTENNHLKEKSEIKSLCGQLSQFSIIDYQLVLYDEKSYKFYQFY